MKRWAAVMAVVLVAVSCGGSADPESQSSTSTVAATPATSSTRATTAATSDPSTSTTAPAPSTTTSTTLAPAADPVMDHWTVILASLPVDEYTEEQALARLDELAVSDGGVFLSTDHATLNPGYWVVYSGVFTGGEEAAAHCRSLTIGCYQRYVGRPPTLANGQALLLVNHDPRDQLFDLQVVSIETGDVVRTIRRDFFEAAWPGRPVIDPPGTAAMLDVGYDDWWYACDGVLSEVTAIDLASGSLSTAMPGSDVVFSPDQRFMAWTEDSACLADPVEPQFFIAYPQTIVVRDLATGVELHWGPNAAIAGTDAATVWSKAWSADSTRLYYRMADGVRELNIATPTAATTDGQQVIPLFGFPEGADVYPLGQLQSGELVVRWSLYDEATGFRTGVDLYDLVDGERIPLAESDDFIAAAVDATGSAVLWAEGTRLRSVGSVEIDIDVGVGIQGIGW